MTYAKLNRKQAEHVRAWLCSLIDPDNLPGNFWDDLNDMGVDPRAVHDYVKQRHDRIQVDFGGPRFTLWD